jgi:hypothetical protein
MATNDVIVQIEQTSGKTKDFPVVPVKGHYLRFNPKTGRPEAAPVDVPKHTHPEYEAPSTIDGGEVI